MRTLLTPTPATDRPWLLRSAAALVTVACTLFAQQPIAREVALDHGGGATFAATLTLPAGEGPHPAALLVSPAGEHPRDELRNGGRHHAELAERLAQHGIATLRVDNRGVGGSQHETWPAWNWSVSLDELARDLAAHVAWLRDQPHIDRNRVGIVAHGDGTIPAAKVGGLGDTKVPAFTVLLSPSGARGLDDLVRRQLARVPADAPAEQRERLAEMLRATFERIIADGDSQEAVAAARAALEAFGVPAEQAGQQASRFVAQFASRWHRDYLDHRPRNTLRAMSWPVLALLAADDDRVDAAASRTAIEDAFRSGGAFNSVVRTLSAGGHFLEPEGRQPVLRDDVVTAIRHFVADATGFLGAAELPRGEPAADVLLLRGATVVDVVAGRCTGPHTVRIEGGQITAVAATDDLPPPAGATTVDASGMFVMPGLVDCHVHVSLWGIDALPRFVAHGVTTVRDMGGDAREQLAWRQRVRSGDLLGPTMLLAGPFLDGDKPNDQYRRVVNRDEAATTIVAELQATGLDHVKVHSMLPVDALAGLVDAANARGMPLAGHIPVGMTPLAAVRAGLRSIEHADSFLSAMARAQPRVVDGWNGARAFWTGDAGKAALQEIAASGAFVVPTLTIIHHAADRIGGPLAAMRPWTIEMTRILHQAGIPLAAGTDCARRLLAFEPGVSLHEELRLLVDVGLSPAEALRTATVNATRLLGRRDAGIVAVGAPADLLVLRADPLADITNTASIAGVVLRGAWLPRERLDVVRAAVERVRED